MALPSMVSKKWMWWIVGITAAVTVIWTIANYAPKSSFRTGAIAQQENKSKEIFGPKSVLKLTEGKWVGPIARPEGWHWSLDYWPEKKIRIRIERRGKIIAECDGGEDLSQQVVTPAARAHDNIFVTSLDGEQVLTLQWVDRS